MTTLVVVEGVNKVKKHQRPNPNKGATGGIVEMENPFQVSNIAIYNPFTRKPTGWVSEFRKAKVKSVISNRAANCLMPE